MTHNRNWICRCSLLAAVLLTAVGCPKADKGKTADDKKDAHAHPDAGPHGGALAEWGEEEYHVEFTVDHARKEATIYILDGSAKKAPKVEAEKLTDLKLSVTNVKPPVTIDLKHDPKKSGDKGIAFVGTHEQLGKETEFKGNVSGKVAGKDFAGDFEEKEHKHEKK